MKIFIHNLHDLTLMRYILPITAYASCTSNGFGYENYGETGVNVSLK